MGYKSDDLYEKCMVALDKKTMLLTVQPNVNGGWQMEFYTWNYDIPNSPSDMYNSKGNGKVAPENLATINPITGKKQTCEIIDNVKSTSGEGILKCGKLNFSQPFDLPMWTNDDQPFKFNSCNQTGNLINCNENPSDCPPSIGPRSNDTVKSCGTTNYWGKPACNSPIMYDPVTKKLSGPCRSSQDNTTCVDNTFDYSTCQPGQQIDARNGILACKN